MRLVKVIGAALTAVFAFGAIVAAGASAHSFVGSSPTLLVLAKKDVGLQVFKTLAGTLECETIEGHGITPATLKTLTQTVTVSYRNCVATGQSELTGKPNEPILAEYEFSADNSVKILKLISIVATVFGAKCTIDVPAQGPLTTITYTNPNNKTILVAANVSEIESKAVGTGCLEQYSTSKTGTYVGNSTVEADAGGSIQWE